jgi:hypothetical protein
MVVMAFKIAGSRAARQPHVIYHLYFHTSVLAEHGGKLSLGFERPKPTAGSFSILNALTETLRDYLEQNNAAPTPLQSRLSGRGRPRHSRDGEACENRPA